MGRRSAEAWRELVVAQERSGKTVKEFCARRGLCARTFLRRRDALGEGCLVGTHSPFVRIEAAASSSSGDAAPCVRLRLGRCEWELNGLPVDELIHMMAALA